MNYKQDTVIDLLDQSWHWQHYDRYEWTSIPEEPEILFLLPAVGAKLTSWNRPKDGNKPSKQSPFLFSYFGNLPASQESFIEFVNKFGPPDLPHLYVRGKKVYDSLNEAATDNPLGTECIYTVSYGELAYEQWVIRLTDRLFHVLDGNCDSSKYPYIGYDPNKFPFGNVVDGRLNFILAEPDDLSELKTAVTGKKYIHNAFSDTSRDVSTILNEQGKPLGIVLSGKLSPGDDKLPVGIFYRLALQRIVASQLEKYPVRLSIILDLKTGDFKQTFRPTSLLALMWYEFYRVITGERKIKQCAICHRYSDVTDNKKNWQRHENCAAGLRSDRSRENKKQRGDYNGSQD